jgi:ankyrin repeat protein
MRDIFEASALGEKKQVADLLTQDKDLAKSRNTEGKTPLHLAGWGGYAQIITLLLDTGADVNARDNAGATPLCYMTGWCTRTDIVDLLVSGGANIDLCDNDGASPVDLAASLIHKSGHCWGDHAKLTQHLIVSGAKIDIFTAAILNRHEDLATLLEKDPSLVSARRHGGYFPAGATPLHAAADRGRLEATEALLDARADIADVDDRGRTALYLAAYDYGTRKDSPSRDVADLLLSRGAPFDIFAAAILGDTARLAELLKSNPSLAQARDAGDSTPLHLAAWNRQLEVAKLLLDHGAPIDAINKRGENPLSLARGPVADLLLERGAECDIFTAIVLGRKDLMVQCLQRDPSVANACNRRGRTPLNLVRESAHFSGQSHSELVATLLAHGAEIDIWTAATLGRHADIDRLLTGDPSLVNRYDNVSTPLHCAIHAKDQRMVEHLLDHGAAIEATTIDLATPLISAMWGNQPDMARLLISRGADINAIDNWSSAPWVASALGLSS